MKTKIRTAYDDDYVDPGIRFVDEHGEPEKTLTIQSEKDACDINKIVEQHAKTGLLPVNTATPIYGDFTGLPSYQESLNIVIKAEEAFMSLDAKIRKEFDNDPGAFLEFAQDENNRDKLIEWGMISPAKEPEPVNVRVIPEQAPKGATE